MVFSCRELLFSTLFSCEQPQAIESLEKGCFSRISDGTLGTFLAWTSSSFRAMVFSCRELLFSTLFSCEQATESLQKCCFSRTRRYGIFGCFSRISDDVWHFFGVVLELARPSEPWCFPAGSCFFRRCFRRTSDATLGSFCVVLDLARPSEPQLILFDAVFLRAATGNRISRKRLFF